MLLALVTAVIGYHLLVISVDNYIEIHKYCFKGKCWRYLGSSVSL